MAVAAVTIHLPDALWHAVQLLAPHGGDPNAVILRTLDEYVTATQKRGRQRTGKCQKLVQISPLDPVVSSNVGQKSMKEIKETLATLGLTLSMTLEDDAYRAAVVATVAANIAATRR